MDNIIKAGNNRRYKKNIIHSILNIIDLCNFNCPYCCNANTRNNKFLPLNIIHDLLEDLGLRNASEYIFSISGGEPFLYPHLSDMLNYMVTFLPNKRRVKFLTNGSLLYKNKELIEEYLPKLAITFALTLHMDNKNLEKLIDEIEKLRFREIINIKILVAPGKINLVKPIIKRLINMGINIYLRGIFDKNISPLSYTDAEIASIKEYQAKEQPILFHEIENSNNIERVNYTHMDKFLNPDLFSYKGLKCAAGLTALRIGTDGKIIPCFGASRKYNFNLAEKRLRDIPELNHPIICPAKRCFCELFLKTPKWKYDKDKPSYLNIN